MEIKVRVWDTNENRMVYNAQNTYDYGYRGVSIWEDSFQDVNESDNYIKMLCSMSVDVNNRDVYEGDILEDKYGCRYIVRLGTINISNQVCVQKYCTCFYKQHFNESFGLEPLNNTEHDEIIGNIYNDPKLLK